MNSATRHAYMMWAYGFANGFAMAMLIVVLASTCASCASGRQPAGPSSAAVVPPWSRKQVTEACAKPDEEPKLPTCPADWYSAGHFECVLAIGRRP